MGERLKMERRRNSDHHGAPADIGSAARQEIDRLLKLRPEYRTFQNEIESRLNAAGRVENRLAVLGIMIEGKLKELEEQLLLLQRNLEGA